MLELHERSVQSLQVGGDVLGPREQDKQRIARWLHDEWSLWLASLLSDAIKLPEGGCYVPAAVLSELRRRQARSLQLLDVFEQNLISDRAERLLQRMEAP